MNDYVKTLEGNNIIFKDVLNNIELVVTHNDNDYIYDTIFIDNKFNIGFIEFVVRELKRAKDLGVIYSLYDSLDLEKLLDNYGLKVSNYQYRISYKDHLEIGDYDISTDFDDESKKFYLETINRIGKLNTKYFNSNTKYIQIDETWFDNKEYNYRTYRKNGKIVGIVDYKILGENQYHEKEVNKIFDYSNKLCVRCLFSEDKSVLEDILKDLLNTHKKDIIISINYTESNLRNAVINVNGQFNYCQYTLIDVLNN